MDGVFLSYTRNDLKDAQTLQHLLEQDGIEVWRDQKSIYAGEKWPKAIGEGIARQRLFILLWSKQAASSHFVEFEWNTAVALEKTIIPVLIDDTPLPPLLRSINAIRFNEPTETKNRILQQLQAAPLPPSAQQEQVLEKLDTIQNQPPEEVNKIARSIYHQEGWTVQGNVYHITGGTVTIGSTNDSGTSSEKKWYQRWETWFTIVAVVVAIGIILRYLSDTQREFPLTIYIHGQDGPSDILDYGKVRVRLGQYRLPTKEVGANGEVSFEAIPLKYLHDTIQLELLSRPYTVLHQSAHTPDESKRITFEVAPTHIQVRGTVYDNGVRVPGAILDVDSGLAVDTTNTQGNFELMIPKGEGEEASISISYQGKERFRRNVTLSAHTPLQLTLDPL